MKRVRRRILWGVTAVLVVLVGLGSYSVFIGKRLFLEYAESFLFQRMTVPQLREQGNFRFFYASNRRLRNSGADIDERFESERGASLTLGFFDTSIEPSLGIGMLVNPSDWFLNEDIQLNEVQTLERDAFVAQLSAQVQASPHRSVLLVIHGFREAFPSALRKTAFVAHVLDINTPVLLFDWPGDQGSSPRGYRRARRVATDSGAELAATLELIVEEVQPDRLWLIANSMGAQVVVDAFSLLYRDPDFSDPQSEIQNVMLTAPDVSHEQFNDQFKKEIKALTSNVTVYVSSNDRALLVSRVINLGRRLGESTLDPTNPSLEAQTASLSELLEPGEERLILVDVTPVNRTRNFHNFSLETPEFFDDLFLRLTGTSVPQTRPLYLVRTPKDTRYFVLTRGN